MYTCTVYGGLSEKIVFSASQHMIPTPKPSPRKLLLLAPKLQNSRNIFPEGFPLYGTLYAAFNAQYVISSFIVLL